MRSLVPEKFAGVFFFFFFIVSDNFFVVVVGLFGEKKMFVLSPFG